MKTTAIITFITALLFSFMLLFESGLANKIGSRRINRSEHEVSRVRSQNNLSTRSSIQRPRNQNDLQSGDTLISTVPTATSSVVTGRKSINRLKNKKLSTTGHPRIRTTRRRSVKPTSTTQSIQDISGKCIDYQVILDPVFFAAKYLHHQISDNIFQSYAIKAESGLTQNYLNFMANCNEDTTNALINELKRANEKGIDSLVTFYSFILDALFKLTPTLSNIDQFGSNLYQQSKTHKPDFMYYQPYIVEPMKLGREFLPNLSTSSAYNRNLSFIDRVIESIEQEIASNPGSTIMVPPLIASRLTYNDPINTVVDFLTKKIKKSLESTPYMKEGREKLYHPSGMMIHAATLIKTLKKKIYGYILESNDSCRIKFYNNGVGCSVDSNCWSGRGRKGNERNEMIIFWGITQ